MNRWLIGVAITLVALAVWEMFLRDAVSGLRK
jgi:nitrogen fixation-related uncharacterized protein